MKKLLTILLILTILFLCGWLITKSVFWYKEKEAEREAEKALNQAIEDVLDSRKLDEEVEDIFGEDNRVNILLIGLDRRAGELQGHCDAIQLFSIDREKQEVLITAVPRGTYSPLPPGKGTTSSDYYVSNACGLGGLEYGIEQIEKILGQKAEYLAVVGFSETMGILRSLKLPTTETLQWLRLRQAYQIGEPQRAHNHSTFLKQMITKYLPDKESKIDDGLHYIVYRMIKTDLSFNQTQSVISELIKMDLKSHPDRIRLSMRPAHEVQDIPYDPENLDAYLESMLGPVSRWLEKSDYSGMSKEDIQKQLIDVISENKESPEFVKWAYDNDLWQQIEDEDKRLLIQFDFLERYLEGIEGKEEREAVIADYILEMEYLKKSKWITRGKNLLVEEIEE